MKTKSAPHDSVKVIQDAMVLKKKQEAIIEKEFRKLHSQAIRKVKSAFKRVFKDTDIQIPQGEIETALPASGDNIRVDFPVVSDSGLNVARIIDSKTGVSFQGLKVDGPVAGIFLQARVPLKILSPSGIEKV